MLIVFTMGLLIGGILTGFGILIGMEVMLNKWDKEDWE